MEASSTGLLLVLNGTSSAGKTSLGLALQDRWSGPLVDAGLDRHLGMLPERYLGRYWPQVFSYELAADGRIVAVSTGPVGQRLVRGMHRVAAALALAGLDVVVDHVLLERAWAVDLARSLAGVQAALVGVRCPMPVLEQRERDRANRTLGQGAAQLPAVHAHGAYDVEVDTSVLNPGEAADTVLKWLASRPRFTAFDRLRSG